MLREFSVPAVILLSSLCSNCTTTGDLEDPRNATTEQAARSEFERDAYCPSTRVSARRLVPMPPAPSIIANDPERLALWQEEWAMRALTDARLIVEVTGCGTRLTYSCWEFSVRGGVRTTGRGQRRDVFGAACLPENGYVSSDIGR